MTTSSSQKLRAIFALVLILVLNFDFIDGKRFSSGRTSSSGGSGGVYKPSVRSSVPRTPVHLPKPSVHATKTSVNAPSRQSAPNFAQPHTPHNSGSMQAKDSSNFLIHAEGGGRSRPASPSNSAPSQNGGYPSWANPSLHQHGGPSPHPRAPQPGNLIKPEVRGPQNSAPYPPIHPGGPINRSPQLSQPLGAIQQPNSYPYPNSPHGVSPPSLPPSVPYPRYHPQGMPMPSAPHIGFGNGSPQSGSSHQPIGVPTRYQPVGSSASPAQPTIVHNHYNAPVPIGTPQNLAGQSFYGHQQPVYGGNGAIGGSPIGSGHFVPGQTVVVLPNQQQASNGGRGFGQLLKEALVFSTVNAGVNRLVNGPPLSYHRDSYPSSQPALGAPSSTSTVTNTVIYNNQYGTRIPDANGTVTQDITQGQAVPITGNSNAQSAGIPNNGLSEFSTLRHGNESSNTVNPTVGVQYPVSPVTTDVQNANGSAINHGQIKTNEKSTFNDSVTNGNKTTLPVPEYEYYVNNEELWNITELLFAKSQLNLSQYVMLNLQNRSFGPNITDLAPELLLNVSNGAYAEPTIQAMRGIYDNYEFDSEKREAMDWYKRRQEKRFLDTFLNTSEMMTAMNWLSDKGYVETNDIFEWKDTLRHIWMSKVNGTTSGFERIFMAERYPGSSILGGQNWIYFDNQELLRRVNYMSYTETINLGNKATLAKINFKIDDVLKTNSTMLIGTSPELEMALYTICYYTRPNDICTVSLAGTKLNFYTHTFRHFGKDIMDLGLVFF